MKLSVLMITYNHEKYIVQALDSILMQKTNFDYEIVIGEDYSNDNTRNILLEYQKKYPEKIKLLLPEKNLGIMRNFIKTYKACCGEYVALLEGDDFWTSHNKLQEQVNFLENHPEFVMCFTNSRIVNEDGDVIKEDRLDEDRRKNLSQSDIISGLVPPSNTVMFRNNVMAKIPEVFYTSVNGDILFFGMLTEYGDAAYIDENTAAYRMHSGGAWSQKPQEYIYKNNLKTRQALLSVFKHKYKYELLSSVNGCYITLLEYYKKTNSLSKFIRTFINYSLYDLKYKNLHFSGCLKYFMLSLLSLIKSKTFL